MFKSKMFYVTLSILFFILLICLVPNKVSAAEINKRTTALDLTLEGTTDKLTEEGWKWDKNTKTLTLENANFDMEKDENGNIKPNITFSKADNITIIFKGNNTIKSKGNSPFYGTGDATGSITLKGDNNAILNLETVMPSVNGCCGCTINYANNLTIKSGTINSIGGFMIDGIFTMDGGNLKINTENMVYGSKSSTVKGIYALNQVVINDGNVDIKANAAAIQVTGSKIKAEKDGVIINGGNISLSTQQKNNAIIHAGYLTEKNIIVNGGNITLEGDYGFYTADGIIEVNHVDSLNTDKVITQVFRVANKEGNDIIYADADYSEVDKAIKKANNLNKSDYKDFSSVDKAISAVIRDKNVLEQKEVDNMAKAIYDAIDSLELVKKVQDTDKSDEQNNVSNTNNNNNNSNNDKQDNSLNTNKKDDTGMDNYLGIAITLLVISSVSIIALNKKEI